MSVPETLLNNSIDENQANYSESILLFRRYVSNWAKVNREIDVDLDVSVYRPIRADRYNDSLIHRLCRS